ITRITAELVEMGLSAENPYSGQVVGANKAAMSVTLNAIRANAGRVDIRGDQLTGSGTWLAPSDASVKIVNDTPAFLRLRGITISEATGGLYLNGTPVTTNTLIAGVNTASASADNRFNQNEPTATPLSSSFAIIPNSTTSRPSVDVQNTLNVTRAGSYAWNDIIVLGGAQGAGIIAPTADLTLATPQVGKGDIQVYGSIVARSQTIVAGGTLFVDGASTLEVDGKPYTAWAAVTRAPFGDGTQSADWMSAATAAEQTTVLGAAPGSSGPALLETGLYADRIIINAEYVNVNGILQSGYDQYTLTLGQAAIDEIRELSTAPGSASRIYLERTSAASRHFSVYFVKGANGGAGTIEVEDVAVSGGYIDITGRVMNTANGKIRSLGGYGRIAITNNTDYDLAVNDVDASRRGAGVVLIKDKSKFAAHLPTPDHQSTAGTRNVTTGDVVQVGDRYYMYIEADGAGAAITTTMDLRVKTTTLTTGQDYALRSKWAVLDTFATLYQM
ncbi:MAG TPA: hypothetical protein VLJ62_30820, partial [Burkholderiaceae bacterium]|nr:hypothetical protein [Burkholderiaceae bacterium]